MRALKRILMYFRSPHWPFKLFKDLIAPVAAVVAAPYTGGASLAVYGAYKGIDAQQQAKKQAAEAARVQAEQQKKVAEQNAILFGGQPPIGTAASFAPSAPAPVQPSGPIIVQVPTAAPVQAGGMPTQTLLLLGGMALVGVLVLRR